MNNEVQKHEELKQCAIYAYGKNNILPDGYAYVNSKKDILTGFNAIVIKSNKNIIIAYSGTDSMLDMIHSDIAMGLQKLPIQIIDAVHLYNQIRQQYPNAKIILTGHSLGGSLAQIVGALNDVETVTFNAYGTKDLIRPENVIYPDRIVNYINLDDYKIITKNTKNQIGTCYSISSRAGSANNHEAEAMLPLQTRAKFDQKTYGKPSRYKHAEPKEVHTSSSNCSGSYPVSGYTKSDGTKVDSYIRTCYLHGNPIKSYAGKSYAQMSEKERDEFLNDYI